MRDLFDKHGGFRRLHTFTLATIIQLETGRFCRRFLTHDHREAGVKLYDPKGRQYDQMVQAARSGRQNIIEGSERASTSKDTEMKLTDVARASLSRADSVGSVVLARSASATPSSFARYGPRIGPRLAHSSACGSICFAITSLPTESAWLSELRGDFEIFILDRGELPWSCHAPEAMEVNAVSLDAPTFTGDMVHESARHAREQRRHYARWLDSEDPLVVANAMLIIIGRALKMLKAQIEAQGAAFERTGGFSERLVARRLAAREGSSPGGPAPECPQCGLPMRLRRSSRGEFWGCTGFPSCRGTLPQGTPGTGGTGDAGGSR